MCSTRNYKLGSKACETDETPFAKSQKKSLLFLIFIISIFQAHKAGVARTKKNLTSFAKNSPYHLRKSLIFTSEFS